MALTWRLADRLAGPRFANLAAAVYVLLPGLAALTMLGTYRSTFLHRAVPNLVGLRGTPWFVLGLAIGAAALFRVAAPVLAVAGLVLLITSWDDLGAIRIGLHETAWSISMLEWLAVAGVVGAALRSRVRAAGLAGWLALALGLASRRGYDDAAFWQSLALAAPAIAVLLSSLWLWCRRSGWRRRRRALAELELEQRDALREDHVLVGDLREHGRVMEQYGEHEEQRYRKKHRRSVRLDSDPTCDRVQTATPRGEREQHESREEPEQGIPLAQPSGADQLEDDEQQQQRRRRRGERHLERRTGDREDHASSNGVTRRRSAPIRIASITFAM